MALCCVSVLGNISRDTIFLRSYRASSISALTLLLSFTTAYALTSVNSLLKRLAAQNASSSVLYAISPAGLASGLLLLALLSLSVPQLAKVTSVGIYIWIEISAQLLTQQFWDLCAKAFDVTQSKKYFGFITFGTTLGSLLASLLILPVLQRQMLPTEYNLIVSALVLYVVALVLYQTAEHYAPRATENKRPAKEVKAQSQTKGITANESSAAIISDIQKRNYLKHICFFDMLATIVRVLVDNTTLSILSLHDEAQVKESLTMINSVQSVMMIPMQFASGPFFTHFGVMYGISILPVTVLLFGGATYTSTAAGSLIFTRALYNAVSLSLFNPARELLWLPFNASERSRFKTFVCGPFRSLSRIVGAIVSMVLTAELFILYFGGSCVSMILMAVAVAWFIDALAARKSYAAEFYASLKQGYVDFSSPIVDFTPDQTALVKETLMSGAQNQVNYVLSSLSHSHIIYFSQELRSVFYRTNREDVPITPLHTKLRLLNLHTAAKREFVVRAQEAFVLPDPSTLPPGIFNMMDLMMLVKEKSQAVPRQLRVAAILACGYEKFNEDNQKCSDMLSKIIQNPDEDKSVVVCAAVALLRLSEWMNEEANIVLQRMLHEEQDMESRVVCLKIVGRELPELLGDGFLVFLLHHSSTQIVQAAVECCSHSARTSRMLIPALVKHLPNPSLRTQIVQALQKFDSGALWGTLSQFVDSTVESVKSNAGRPDSVQLHQRREALSGALKLLLTGTFPVEDKLKLVLHLLDVMIGASKQMTQLGREDDALHRLFGMDSHVEEQIIDALIELISRIDSKLMQSYEHLMHPVHAVLDIKIYEAYEMRHVTSLLHAMCPRNADNIEDSSPLLLQHVEHYIKDSLRVLLKLLSTGFPKEFNVAVILEGLQSDLPQAHGAIQEVLENLLPSAYKSLILPLLFPKATAGKSTAKMEKDVKEMFNEKSGMDLLLETMQQEQAHVELSCLALQYFLHIAEYHKEFMTDSTKEKFGADILPRLLDHKLPRELLIETYHSQPDVLPWDQVHGLQIEDAPLISRVAISNCLRVSALFENVCAIDILRILSHHFTPMKVSQGTTFAVEGDLATCMYVVAAGHVQLHKERRILADLGYGACVGQAALLRHSSHSGNHIASATATSDSVLLSVSREALDALMRENPRVSRGVLNAVACSLRWLYFEPLDAIAESGCLPRRSRSSSMMMRRSSLSAPQSDGANPVLMKTESLASSLKAVMSVDRAAKSFLYNIGRSRKSESPQPTSLPGNRSRNRSFNLSPSPSMPNRPEALRTLSTSSDPADFTHFEKCIHLKGSQLVRNLDDDKVSLVAQLSRVTSLSHGEVLYEDGATAQSVFVIIEGTIAITKPPKSDGQHHNSFPAIELHDGDCFGEEVGYITLYWHFRSLIQTLQQSFVANTGMNGQAASIGRSTLFDIAVKELIELSELHPDVMRVVIAWLAYKLAKSTESMVTPLLSPQSTRREPLWSDDALSESEEPLSSPTLTNRSGKSRAQST
ncbi:TPA: hypothetical protein N0F65_001259 [Lagenidium giganteum]|uniref:Cyclic nucleotide-binding domain-containing protein n=1 Tax=Lagenidium giganteum TaxID=4803 RepID=A0AAV2YSV6_9STRA|nr:TPA: hypothetical protein N0F65_001259 [Lagenidium giganteum]